MNLPPRSAVHRCDLAVQLLPGVYSRMGLPSKTMFGLLALPPRPNSPPGSVSAVYDEGLEQGTDLCVQIRSDL